MYNYVFPRVDIFRNDFLHLLKRSEIIFGFIFFPIQNQIVQEYSKHLLIFIILSLSTVKSRSIIELQ